MSPSLVIIGRLNREFILPLTGRPLLDAPGGNLLYAAVGAAIWTRNIGLLGRVGEDYPQAWLQTFEQAGWDTRGIRILPYPLDVRAFYAWLDTKTVEVDNPTAQFARLRLPFPRGLLGYHPAQNSESVLPPPASPRPEDIPAEYRAARAVHLCPLDAPSVSRLLAAFQENKSLLLTLDSPLLTSWETLRPLLYNLAAFLLSEQTLRALFAGKTENLWDMIEEVASHGCARVVVRRDSGSQVVYDAASRQRWEIPPYPARLADPTGAGDAFCGGFLAGLVETGDSLQAALYGNVSASLTVEGSGALYALEALPGLASARLESLRSLARPV